MGDFFLDTQYSQPVRNKKFQVYDLLIGYTVTCIKLTLPYQILQSQAYKYYQYIILNSDADPVLKGGRSRFSKSGSDLVPVFKI